MSDIQKPEGGIDLDIANIEVAASPVRTVECPKCTARWYGDDVRDECVVCHVPTVEVATE